MVMSMWSRFWPTQYVRVVLTGSRPDVITATKPGFRIAYCASAYPVDGTAGIMFSGCPSVWACVLQCICACIRASRRIHSCIRLWFSVAYFRFAVKLSTHACFYWSSFSSTKLNRWNLERVIINCVVYHIHHRHCYYHSAHKLVLILSPSHGEWKAESTWALQ